MLGVFVLYLSMSRSWVKVPKVEYLELYVDNNNMHG